MSLLLLSFFYNLRDQFVSFCSLLKDDWTILIFITWKTAFTYFHRLNDTMSWILLKPSGTLQVGPLSTLISFGPIEPLFKVRLQPLLNFCQNFLEKSSTLKMTITPPFMDGFSTSWRLFWRFRWGRSNGILHFELQRLWRPLRPPEPILQMWKYLQCIF